MFSLLRRAIPLALFAVTGAVQPATAQTLSQNNAIVPSKVTSTKLSSYALSQIAALQAEKAALTPVQQKIESNLLRASFQALPAVQPRALNANTIRLVNSVGISRKAQPDANGMVLVDIKGTVSTSLLAQIKAAGGVVQGSWPNYGAIRATLPVTQLQTIAGMSSVLSIRPASQAHLVRSRETPLSGQGFDLSDPSAPIHAGPKPLVPGLPELSALPALTAAERRERIRAALPALLARVHAAQVAQNHRDSNTSDAKFSLSALAGGLVNTADPEGDLAQRAALARSTFHVTGAGIRIGVLSDSVDGLASEQRRGSLGPVTVLPSQSGVPGTGEGTAMLEIVHRIAPNAQLYFATAFISEASFASNIIALQQAGCNVIVDDVAYGDEPPFQDGIIAQAVDTVSAAGAYYFSSAGNNYNIDQFGTSANWEGNFVDSGKSVLGFDGVLAFDSAGDNLDQVFTADAAPDQVAILFWADPQSTAFSGATDDYDLYVTDPTGSKVIFSSIDPHTGLPGEDPIQACDADQDDLIFVVKNRGNAVDLHLDVTSDGAAILNIATPGGTFGHNSAASCYGTAAADALVPYSHNRTFQPSDVTEVYSSDGPRRIIFNADGTEITPGNRTSTGGILRQKPVLASSDDISDFFNPFQGTSAAAPHAAAIAGLVLSANPSLKTQPDQMFTLLTSSCIPIDNPTDATAYYSDGTPVAFFDPLPNRDTGYGLLDAYMAVQNAVALTKTPASLKK
ncbi:MAG: S8 family serine peptidase [Janthinobacterium lividum]